MNNLPIFTETPDGKLIAMRPSAPQNEDSLQELIANFPEIISENGEDLLLIRREQTVPDMMDGAGRWSLDNLFVTRNAIPVLVEVKRASDTRIRREVIGQLLDYAANGVAYWKPGTFAKEFEAQCISEGIDPDIYLSEFLDGKDESNFWDQVDANLQSGRIKLIVAADKIPKELARIVEFLNEQMRCTVLAVELTYFEAENGQRTLAPKIIGETERAEIAKTSRKEKLPPISNEEWLDTYLTQTDANTKTAITHYFELLQSLSAQTIVAEARGSIIAYWKASDGKTINLLFLRSNGQLEIGFRWVKNRPALQNNDVRRKSLDAIDKSVGGLSTQNIDGYPSFPITRLNTPSVLEAFKSELQAFVTLIIKGA